MNTYRKCRESKWGYVAGKLFAFFLIYAVAAVIMEGIILLSFYLIGYDALNGDIPKEQWASLVPLYGFAGFGIVTSLYIHLVEKKSWSEYLLDFSGKGVVKFVRSAIQGAVLVTITIMILTCIGAYRYTGVHLSSGQEQWMLLTLGAYAIQGTVEELMCRGFLQNALCARIREKSAIVIVAVVFLLPHLGTVTMMSWSMAIIAVANLMLVSFLFSYVMLTNHNVLAACGFHVGWNYMLGCVLGLQVSGENVAAGVFCFQIESTRAWLTGGEYGMEASLLLTVVLLILDIIMYRKREGKNGIS